MNIQFDEEKHEYRVHGNVVQSVTTILAPLTNYDMVNAELLERGRQMGSAVHLATELYDAGRLDYSQLDQRLVPYLEAWQRFRAEVGFHPIHSEMSVFHPAYHYAGRFDRVGIVKGKKAVIDIKKMMALPAVIGLQLAAYQEAYNHSMPAQQRIVDRYAVGLRPDGTYQMKLFNDAADFSVFVSQLTINQWRKKHGLK